MLLSKDIKMRSKHLIQKLKILNYKVYPFLAVITFAALLIESVTYAGFLGKHIIFGAKFFLISSLFSGIIQLLYTNEREKSLLLNYVSLNKLVINFNYLLAPALIIVYYVMVSTEAANYPNYIFSTYHVLPENVIYLVFFNLFNVFLGITGGFKDTTSTHPYLKRFGYSSGLKQLLILVMVVFLLYFGIENMGKTTIDLIKEGSFIVLHPYASYDEKMETRWPFFYGYMKFVKDNTPESSAIAIPPPVRPWLSVGNSVLVRYFLYPRFLITDENEFPTDRNPDYFLLTRGLWNAYDEKDYGWPKDYLKAEYILYLEQNPYSVTKLEEDFDPSDPKNREGWGLIKIEY